MKQSELVQRNYYTETASAYDSLHLGDNEHSVALNWVSRFARLLGFSSVLDVGCGTGRAVRFLMDRGVTVNGVEPVPALLERAIEDHAIPASLLTVGSGTALPFTDGSFDAVCEFAVLHHVRDPEVVVREMTRVARRAVFLSDSNRFGQGPMLGRVTKLLLCKSGLWNIANHIRTGGRGYTLSDGDGLAYSYSVFDSLSVLSEWAEDVILISTSGKASQSWLHPLLTSSSVLLCAFKDVNCSTECEAKQIHIHS